MQTTPIKSLYDTYGTALIHFTILETMQNEYENTLIKMQVTHDDSMDIITINCPANQEWKEVQPKQGIAYTAKIKYNEKYNRYSFVPIEEVVLPLTTPVDYTTTLTTYTGLPFKNGETIKVVCVVLDPTVDNPSMLLGTTKGTFRVVVPKTVKDINAINGKFISITLKRGLIKTRLVITEILDDMTSAMITELTTTKLHSESVTAQSSNNPSEPLIITTPVEVTKGSLWINIETNAKVTVEQVEPINEGQLIWTPNSYYTSIDFLSRFTPIQQQWDDPIPSKGVLAKLMTDHSVVVILKPDSSNINKYISLTDNEVLEYCYEQLPF